MLKAYEKEKVGSVVMVGQSNAEGYGVGEVSQEWILDERILWLNDNSCP